MLHNGEGGNRQSYVLSFLRGLELTTRRSQIRQKSVNVSHILPFTRGQAKRTHVACFWYFTHAANITLVFVHMVCFRCCKQTQPSIARNHAMRICWCDRAGCVDFAWWSSISCRGWGQTAQCPVPRTPPSTPSAHIYSMLHVQRHGNLVRRRRPLACLACKAPGETLSWDWQNL